MARGRTARAPKDDSGEVKEKDFAGAVEAYRNDIAPNRTKINELAQENSTAFKGVKKNCHIQRKSLSDAIAIHEMEEAHRHDYWRGLTGVLKELGTDLGGNDLVDRAEGKMEAPAPKPKPKLVTVPTPPADDSDLADPAPGTSAAAVAAMRADHAKDKAEEDFDGPPPRNEPAEG